MVEKGDVGGRGTGRGVSGVAEEGREGGELGALFPRTVCCLEFQMMGGKKRRTGRGERCCM